ncbi:MAG: hypothetical protein ACYCY9_09265, partial [Thiobacillus sp.]
PASASRRNPMICSSVKRFFMSNLLHQWDWTPKLRATQTGGTSRSQQTLLSCPMLKSLNK